MGTRRRTKPERKLNRKVVRPAWLKRLSDCRTTMSCIEPPISPHGWHAMTATAELSNLTRALMVR